MEPLSTVPNSRAAAHASASERSSTCVIDTWELELKGLVCVQFVVMAIG
jgi:hypothetical protein